MTIDEKRTTMKAFCKSANCKRCPVIVIFGELCMKYKMENAPEGLIEKAYALAFREIKEDKQMNITADDIRKAALELIGEMAQGECECIGADGLSAKVTIGYIVGAKDLAEKMIEMIEESDAAREEQQNG